VTVPDGVPPGRMAGEIAEPGADYSESGRLPRGAREGLSAGRFKPDPPPLAGRTFRPCPPLL
jgi:hypothetical protein